MFLSNLPANRSIRANSQTRWPLAWENGDEGRVGDCVGKVLDQAALAGVLVIWI